MKTEYGFSLSLLAAALLAVCPSWTDASRAAPDSGDDSIGRPDSLAVWSPVDTVYALPPMIMEAARPEEVEAAELSSLSISIVVPAEHPRRLATAEEILHELPGLEIRNYGGLGAFSTASLRGSGGQEVAVFLDGVDLRSPFTGVALLADLPLVGADRIEVYRGGVPGELGGGAMSGAIQVVTGRETYRRASLGSGGFGYRRAALEMNGRGPWGTSVFLSAALTGSDNDFEYLDDNGTIHNTADDHPAVRRNAAFTGRDLLTSLNWQPARRGWPGRWTLHYRYLWRENGIPGSASIPFESLGSRRNGHDGRVTWRGPVIADRLRLRVRAYLMIGWNRFLNPDGESIPATFAYETKDRLLTRGLQLHSDLYLPPLHLMLRIERRHDKALHEKLDPDLPREDERLRDAWRAETEARLLLFADRLLLQAGYGEAWLNDNYFNDTVSPMPWIPETPGAQRETHEAFRSAGVNWRGFDRPLRSGRWVLDLRAGIDNGYRAPSLLELFGQDVTVRGNTRLLSEKGVQWDVGVGLEFRRSGFSARFDATRFDRDVDNLIFYRFNSQFSVLPENLASSEITGEEISARFDWRAAGARWRLSLADTRQEALDTSGHEAYHLKKLPYRTPHTFFARVGCAVSRFTLRADATAKSRVYSDRYNIDEAALPAATLWGAGVGLRLWEHVQLDVEGLNLGDEDTSDIHGYPLPGRTWRVGLEWSDRPSDEI